MPRPRMFWFSSMTTALVVVEPRSMPMKQRMVTSASASRHDRDERRTTGASRGRALLLDHLEVALETVLDVRSGEIARIDEIGLDEGCRLAGAPLDLAQDQQLACGKAVAALDRVDQQP